ncbi:hypothetical protein N658DRAFT_488207 [Parathielavia hyrcaniae]|uniref:Sulfatase N-terminal domain-containing protein n=1 Tax=Parathielavia hyrcaniae TaxID=113614 RepID=A0AAN6PVC9_9PEZI|nr:hypothetical protein N658DRAFT_488207 [Parathielavia hyrcaniae]
MCDIQSVTLGLGESWGPRPQGKKANTVFILTDDQDLHLQSLDLPLIKKHLISQGTLHKRHCCTMAICCPSKVSLWTGKLARTPWTTTRRPSFQRNSDRPVNHATQHSNDVLAQKRPSTSSTRKPPTSCTITTTDS